MSGLDLNTISKETLIPLLSVINGNTALTTIRLHGFRHFLRRIRFSGTANITVNGYKKNQSVENAGMAFAKGANERNEFSEKM